MTPDVAFETDVGLVAQETGLSLSEVRDSLTFQQKFQQLAGEVIDQFPGQISAVWMDPLPARSGHIVFVGTAPDIADTRSTGGDIEIRGGGRLSFEEQYNRAMEMSKAMVAMGHKEHSTYYDHPTQRIRVEDLPDINGAMVSADELLAEVTLRLNLRSDLEGDAKQMSVADFTVERMIEVPTPGTARGGQRTVDTGISSCTSGWAVRKSVGGTPTGVMGAAHCFGLDTITDPGVTTHTMSFQGQVSTYADGDVEWHTTSGAEEPRFHASSTQIRDADFFVLTGSMVGGTTCFYGRSSNVRSCGHTVEAVNVCVFASAPINGTVCSLARSASPGANPIGAGDSGGGVSFDTSAWGVFSSFTSTHNWFTPMGEAQNALGVTMIP